MHIYNIIVQGTNKKFSVLSVAWGWTAEILESDVDLWPYHYGPGALKSTSAAAKQVLSSKRKATVKSYAKAKPQPSKIKLVTKLKDAGKKKAVQYKRLPKAQKISNYQEKGDCRQEKIWRSKNPV